MAEFQSALYIIPIIIEDGFERNASEAEIKAMGKDVFMGKITMSEGTYTDALSDLQEVLTRIREAFQDAEKEEDGT